MNADKLKLNGDKTEFMIIGTRTQLAKINITELMIEQAKVAMVSDALNLGVWFDDKLSMKTAINKTCQSVLIIFIILGASIKKTTRSRLSRQLSCRG